MRRLKLLLALVLTACGTAAAETRPNIVWLVAEDMSPDLGCYGDPQAITPNLDRLARQGARFTRCYTHAPVCAPSRSGLITGRYPTSIGTHHMRSKLLAPPPTFTSLLRQAGYFVAWPGKTDFNFDVPPEAFDSTADWIKNPPRQPFFAFLNFNESHESAIRMTNNYRRATARLKPDEFHDPARMVLPPYYPDTPEVRRDVANYCDLVTAVDHHVAEVLKWVDAQGLATNTIVFFFGDHGRGLPRHKRWIYDSGLRVPLLVRWPGHLQPGTLREDLVSFIDFAPTMLALAGAPIPPEMQGQVFLGPKAAPPRKYIFAARDRMDETYDRIRAVRSERFKYIRNFEPGLPYAQRIAYMDEMPTMQVWRRLNAEGQLAGPQKLLFAPVKPREELYDTQADPHEIHNLADVFRHSARGDARPTSPGEAVLQELRAALDQWLADTHDLGAMPEEELIRRGLVKDVLGEYAKRRPQ